MLEEAFPSSGRPGAVVHDAERGCWLRFAPPLEVVSARTLDEVPPALRLLERRTACGLWGVGWVSYEAAPAFDPALRVRPDEAFPRLWFGLFDAPAEHRELPPCAARGGALPPHSRQEATTGPAAYEAAIRSVRQAIREGETYQVNFTYRIVAEAPADPWSAFLELAEAQPSPYAAYLETPDWTLCSASPELFFRRVGDLVESRPMKGTAARGPGTLQDLRNRSALLASEKERAEHVMIVDMVRNDLGRIAETGSVEVSELLAAERYPTVWQLVSTVRARTGASLTEIFSALFPPASITGAPKARTMALIAGLESTPRRAYTGAIGFLAPDGRAQFNVAIRTLLCDRRSGRAEYGTGGGIVWDSEASAERRECELKARILAVRRPAFDLLETLLWTPLRGFAGLDAHFHRLSASAAYFGFRLDPSATRQALLRAAAALPPLPHRVRLLVSPKGAIHIAAEARSGPQGFPDPVLDSEAVDEEDPFLHHKTTVRTVYAEALARHPGAGEVLLWNSRGEVTETTVANLVYRLEGRLWTPPADCGLLPGTYREWLLATQRVRERVLRVGELDRVTGFLLVNSVRGAHRVRMRSRPGG